MKRGLAGMWKSAAVKVVPKRRATATPRPIKVTAAIPVPMLPTLLIHLPTPSPTMLSVTISTKSSNDAMTVNALLSANAAWPGPSVNTETPTKYSMTVGTYIMLLVQ